MLVKHKIVSKLTASNDKFFVTIVKYALFYLTLFIAKTYCTVHTLLTVMF